MEEHREDHTLVIRADLPGIDPDKDVEMTVADGVFRLRVHQREEQMTVDRPHRRPATCHGSFTRSLLLPPGTEESDLKTTYRDGVLEVRVPL